MTNQYVTMRKYEIASMDKAIKSAYSLVSLLGLTYLGLRLFSVDVGIGYGTALIIFVASVLALFLLSNIYDREISFVDFCIRETEGKKEKVVRIEKALYDEVSPETFARLRSCNISLQSIEIIPSKQGMDQ